jgi:inorganic pyrophosphatase
MISSRWKLVALAGEPWELYDMESDRTELNDLAAQYPDRIAALSAQYEEWAKRTHVVVDGLDDEAAKPAKKAKTNKKKAKLGANVP